ncbi:hypothetical protein KSF78_0004181 [Schistosoma japonicum]|nr:hypothetical protein KSF78_0004181 [Schistosoma japonicum]
MWPLIVSADDVHETHSRCENCVEVLFVRGSGLCAQCKTPIRKTNFRYQLFEDPLVQKEIDIRKKLLSDFNKREDDFDCLEEYDLYLEKIEELVYNLTNDVNVEETRRYIENYKKENKEIIKKNRTRPANDFSFTFVIKIMLTTDANHSASMAFYDSELERECILREKREREEDEEDEAPKESKSSRISDDSNSLTTTESEGEKRKNIPLTPRTNMLIAPVSAFGRRGPASFVSPSVYAPPSYIPPPTQALSHAPASSFPVHSLVTPASGFMAPPSMFPTAPPTSSLTNNWISGTHHIIHLPPVSSVRKQQDTVLIPSQHTSHNTKSHTVSPQFVYEPYLVELCGPLPPLLNNHHIRWIDILRMYEKTIIAGLSRQARGLAYTSDEKPKLEMEDENNHEDFDVKPNYKVEESFLDNQIKKEYCSDNNDHADNKGKVSKVEDSCETKMSGGFSRQLTAGACGISPAVFIERPTSVFFPVCSVKYLSNLPMASNINHVNKQFPSPEEYSELKEGLKSCGKLPPLNEMQLDRSCFKREVPMIFVGIQCDKHLKTSIEKLKPSFPHFIRMPKISKTYLDSNGLLRKLMLIQMPESDKILQWIADLNQWNIDLPKDYSNPQSIDLSLTNSSKFVNDEKTDNSLNGKTISKVSNVDKVTNVFDDIVSSPCLVNVSLNYENFTFEQVIKELLPDFVLPITGFTVIGHVVQFNLKPEALPYRHIIGQVALDKLPNIRTVIHKVSVIESAYRTFEMELLAGVPDYVTSIRENNVTFQLDISKVYWNSRLGTEHTRVVKSLRPSLPVDSPSLTPRPIPGDRVVVYDVFAGVGPFSIPAGRAGCHVLANDLNPDSFIWLKKNITQNASRKHPLNNITCYNMDGREFIREILLPHYKKYGNSDLIKSTDCDPVSLSIDRFVVIMNLPQLAIEFLDSFLPPQHSMKSSNDNSYITAHLMDSSVVRQKFFKPLYIHCYCFMKRNVESEQTVQLRLAKALNTDITDLFQLTSSTNEIIHHDKVELTDDKCFIKNWNYRFVRNVAPFKDMYCAEFELYLPRLWLFYNYSSPTVAKRSRTTENELSG